MKADNDNFSCFYVYVWRDAIGIPFYVGKGKNRRAYDLYDRSDEFLEVHANGGCSVEIVDWFIHESQALAYEIELIERYGRREYGGTLVNKTDGGDGGAGHIKSAETIERWRASNIGLKRSAEACARISEGKKRRGFKHSDEARTKMSEAQRKRNAERVERERAAFHLTPDGMAKLSIVRVMRTISPLRRVRFIQKAGGQKHTERTKKKISVALSGVPKRPETVEKFRIAQRMKPPRGQYKGVSADRHKWRAIISIDGRNRYLGCFDAAEDAAMAYDRAALDAWGMGNCFINLPHAVNDNAVGQKIAA